jgi:general secretion pathway protein K
MRHRSEEGIALIAVLWTLTLLSIIAAVLSLETRSTSRVARNMADNAAARAAADAGVQRVMLNLVSSSNALTDIREFRFDGTIYVWRFANSTVHISAQDESSKIDLNQASEALLAALFRSIGVNGDKAQSLADAIADFRDADNLTRPRGAEEAEYRSAGLSFGPKNAPFQAIEELQQVLGMTREVYQQVAPDLTIYSVVDYSFAPQSPLAADGRLGGIILRAGMNSSPVRKPGLAFSIRAEAESSTGADFVREAIVQPDPARAVPLVLSWREGRPKWFGDSPSSGDSR